MPYDIQKLLASSPQVTRRFEGHGQEPQASQGDLDMNEFGAGFAGKSSLKDAPIVVALVEGKAVLIEGRQRLLLMSRTPDPKTGQPRTSVNNNEVVVDESVKTAEDADYAAVVRQVNRRGALSHEQIREMARYLRAHRKLTQRDLAKTFGVGLGTMNRILNAIEAEEAVPPPLPTPSAQQVIADAASEARSQRTEGSEQREGEQPEGTPPAEGEPQAPGTESETPAEGEQETPETGQVVQAGLTLATAPEPLTPEQMGSKWAYEWDKRLSGLAAQVTDRTQEWEPGGFFTATGDPDADPETWTPEFTGRARLAQVAYARDAARRAAALFTALADVLDSILPEAEEEPPAEVASQGESAGDAA